VPPTNLAQALQDAMIDVGRRLHARGLVAASDGNLSARLEDGGILITASGAHLGELTQDDFVCVMADGTPAGAGRAPSSEMPLHLSVYRLRPEVWAVVHAHPPIATAFSFAGLPLDEPVIPEVVVALGRIGLAPYATPGSSEGADAIARVIAAHDAIVLERHGVVTVGGAPLDAYWKMEKVEHAADILFRARLLGRVTPLSRDELERLASLFERMKLGTRDDFWRRLGTRSG